MGRVSISEIRANPAKLWNSSDGSETVITVRGKPKNVPKCTLVHFALEMYNKRPEMPDVTRTCW